MCHPQWQHSDDRQRFSLGAPEPRSRSSSQSIKRWVHHENACRRWAGLSIMLGSTVDNSMTRSEEHTSELQSLMRISYAVFCLKKKNQQHKYIIHKNTCINK